MHILDTERLSIREFTLEDAPFVLRLVNEPSFHQFIGDKGVRTLADAREYLLAGPMASYEAHGYGLFLVKLRPGGPPIGMCGLLHREHLPDVDVGFAFLPEFWGQGYALESAAAVMEYGRKELDLARIVALTGADNVRSARLLEKLGLRFERVTRLMDDGEDLRLFVPDGAGGEA